MRRNASWAVLAALALLGTQAAAQEKSKPEPLPAPERSAPGPETPAPAPPPQHPGPGWRTPAELPGPAPAYVDPRTGAWQQHAIPPAYAAPGPAFEGPAPTDATALPHAPLLQRVRCRLAPRP